MKSRKGRAEQRRKAEQEAAWEAFTFHGVVGYGDLTIPTGAIARAMTRRMAGKSALTKAYLAACRAAGHEVFEICPGAWVIQEGAEQ